MVYEAEIYRNRTFVISVSRRFTKGTENNEESEFPVNCGTWTTETSRTVTLKLRVNFI